MQTEHLAIAIGGYAVLAGIGWLLDPPKFHRMFAGLRDNPATAFMTGIVVYFLGALILVSHHRWDGALEVAVTLFAIGAVLEGAGFLVGSGTFVAVAARLGLTRSHRAWATIYLLAGVAAMAAGIARIV